MGLMLSVLVFSVGVIEAIACYERFKLGYIPLSYQRLRKHSQTFQFNEERIETDSLRTDLPVLETVNVTDTFKESFGTSTKPEGILKSAKVPRVSEANLNGTESNHLTDEDEEENGSASSQDTVISVHEIDQLIDECDTYLVEEPISPEENANRRPLTFPFKDKSGAVEIKQESSASGALTRSRGRKKKRVRFNLDEIQIVDSDSGSEDEPEEVNSGDAEEVIASNFESHLRSELMRLVVEQNREGSLELSESLRTSESVQEKKRLESNLTNEGLIDITDENVSISQVKEVSEEPQPPCNVKAITKSNEKQEDINTYMEKSIDIQDSMITSESNVTDDIIDNNNTKNNVIDNITTDDSQKNLSSETIIIDESIDKTTEIKTPMNASSKEFEMSTNHLKTDAQIDDDRRASDTNVSDSNKIVLDIAETICDEHENAEEEKIRDLRISETVISEIDSCTGMKEDARVDQSRQFETEDAKSHAFDTRAREISECFEVIAGEEKLSKTNEIVKSDDIYADTGISRKNHEDVNKISGPTEKLVESRIELFGVREKFESEKGNVEDTREPNASIEDDTVEQVAPSVEAFSHDTNKDAESVGTKEDVEKDAESIGTKEDVDKDAEPIGTKKDVEKGAESIGTKEDVEKDAESIGTKEDVEKDAEPIGTKKDVEKDAESIGTKKDVEKDAESIGTKEDVEKDAESIGTKEDVEKDAESIGTKKDACLKNEDEMPRGEEVSSVDNAALSLEVSIDLDGNRNGTKLEVETFHSSRIGEVTTEHVSCIAEGEAGIVERKNDEEEEDVTRVDGTLVNVMTERIESSLDEEDLDIEVVQLEPYVNGPPSPRAITQNNNAFEGQRVAAASAPPEAESKRRIASDDPSSPDKAFWLIFSGEYTKAMSKDWHSSHFCCWQCDESLTGQRYVLREEHPYCIKCYESVFANSCEECSRIIGIDSKDLSYKDKHWHEACFLCSKCRVSLVDKQFGSKADKIYCGNCYDQQFASRCDGCGQIFRAGTKKMEYKTRQWHEQCFCCCVCKTPIGTKSFIPREQEIYCAGCYEEKFATRCVKCNKIITSGGVTYKNEPWHRECFTCANCNTSLAGQRFTSRDEKPYCADCFGELFAKRCTACCKPITGIGGTRFISFEDRHWHNDCFICAACKASLVGRGFITDGEDIICPECAKQKLM